MAQLLMAIGRPQAPHIDHSFANRDFPVGFVFMVGRMEFGSFPPASALTKPFHPRNAGYPGRSSVEICVLSAEHLFMDICMRDSSTRQILRISRSRQAPVYPAREGSNTFTVVFPGLLRSRIAPPSCCTRPSATLSPSPSESRLFFVEKKG